MRKIFRGDALARIRDETTDETVGAFVSHRDRSFRRELTGVAQEVRHDLREPVPFRMGDERSFGQVADQLHRSFESEKVNLLQVPEQFVHVDVRVDELELSGFDFRQVEDIVDQLQQQFVVRFDNFAEFGDLFGIPRLGDQVRKTDDRVQRSAYLVTHVGEERRFETVRFLGPVAQNDQLVRHVFQVGDIAPQPRLSW